MFEMCFGSISIAFDDVRYWLCQADGEAMEVGVIELEKLLQKYHEGDF